MGQSIRCLQKVIKSKIKNSRHPFHISKKKKFSEFFIPVYNLEYDVKEMMLLSDHFLRKADGKINYILGNFS